jgi:hypothetical protein
MNVKQAERIYKRLLDRFPDIDCRVDISKKPHYASQTWIATADIPVYYNGLCILVITSEQQFEGFIQLCQSFKQLA